MAAIFASSWLLCGSWALSKLQQLQFNSLDLWNCGFEQAKSIVCLEIFAQFLRTLKDISYNTRF